MGTQLRDIAAARKKLGMSQDKFALTFGISAGALRN
jgi:DNA-binding transcriptional regulator YiaG